MFYCRFSISKISNALVKEICACIAGNLFYSYRESSKDFFFNYLLNFKTKIILSYYKIQIIIIILKFRQLLSYFINSINTVHYNIMYDTFYARQDYYSLLFFIILCIICSIIRYFVLLYRLSVEQHFSSRGAPR